MPQRSHEPFALLIDDENARRESLSRRFEALGIPTVGVSHVLLALNRLAEDDAIRLVLIDEDVAEEAGFRTLVQAARTGGGRPQTIMLMSDTDRRTRYRGSGVQAFSQRPADVRGAAALLDLALDEIDPSHDFDLTG